MEWKGKKVKFSAQTASLTPNFLNGAKSTADYPKAVCGVLRSWSLSDGEKPWPITEEAVGSLPTAFLDALLTRITESWAGDEAKKKASANG